MQRTKPTVLISMAAVAALALSQGACTASPDAVGSASAPITEPSAAADAGVPMSADAGVRTSTLDVGQRADGTSKINPLEHPAFESVSCGNVDCDDDERCCHATGQCFPADCLDCCDGLRRGYVEDEPHVFDTHPGPADAPVWDGEDDDGWIKHDLDPDWPDPTEQP